MNELNSSMEEAELSKTLKKLEILEAEKGDIVLGFIKEKEINEAIHREQLEQLNVKHEDEIQALREEWLEERKKLLRHSDSQQMDAQFHNERKTKEIEEKLRKKSQEDVKETEKEFRIEKRKLREEYEAVISQKTSEIEELYRENCILRSKSDPGTFEDKHKESEMMFNKLRSKINALEEEKLVQIMKLKNDFESEKAELEREQIREKAEFVKQLASKYEQQNTHNEIEKNESFLAYKKEMKEKIEIVEKLWEERNAEDRKKMNTRLENEIAVQKRRFADELQAQLSEKDMEIEDLERQKEELFNSIHVERFELAKAYNRELSILNRLDSPTKEDIEVALIDEVAKLRDEQQKVIRNLEKRYKRKMRDLKKSQKPLAEIEEEHKNELEELRNNFEREKEELEAKLRNEQLNILKSFEFEKNDLERYYIQHMEEQESEFQDEIQAMQSEYDKVENKIVALEKENEELKNQVAQEKERNGELFDKLQECESKNARLKEEIERDKRNMREPVEEVSAVENDNENIKQTVERLSSLNAQLSDELEKERKKCDNLLEKIHELEKEHESLMLRLEVDELQSSESGLELFTSPTEKLGRSTRENDSSSDSSSIEEKNSKEPQKKSEPNQEDLDMQMKLQDSVQEYLLEIKVLQNAMDEKEMEIKQLRDTFAKEKSDLMGQIQDLSDSLKNAVDDEDGADEEEDVEELKSRYKKLTDSINQAIKDLADKKSSSEPSNTLGQQIYPETSGQQNAKGFANEIEALDEVLSDEMEPGVKDSLGKKIEAIKNNITRSHELEILEQQRKHEQVKNRYLKELSDERQKELDVSGEIWEVVCEKLGIDKEEGREKLKEMLREKDVPNGDSASQKIESETNDKPNDDGNTNDMETKEEKCPDSEELKNLKGENESLRRALKELDSHYKKDKEELKEKLQTQHKEFVLSSEAEVIEKLLKEKSALEEEAVIERFNLGRIYYMEMQYELEEILSQRKEDMNKEHEKEMLNIVLKFNKDIADLHKLLADKDENEIKLLQEKNALAKKVLNAQRRMRENEKDENNNTDDILAEAKKLEALLPLKKELADLQQQRQDEHEAGIQNLEKALDLIKDLLNDQNSRDDSLHRRYSFASTSSQSDRNSRAESHTGQKSPTTVQESVLSDEEIHTKEDLQKALEDLIDNCMSKEKDDAESDTSSGASSDFESEPSTPPCESEEGVSDSGAESIENECLSIKKADLEMAMNLERFSLGRIYYNEFKDSLESVLKKLDKLKKMNQDLEDKLSSGVKDLVNRTVFGKMKVQSVDIHTQTLEIDDPIKKRIDDLSDSDQKDISLDTSSKVLEQGDVKGDKVDEHVKHGSSSNAITGDTVKKGVETQTDDLQDYIKTAEQTNERKDTDGKGNMVKDSIKEMSKKDTTTQNDDLQDHMEDTDELNEENGVVHKHDDQIKDAIPQKQDDFPNDEENNQKQSEDIVSEALPQKEKGIEDKHDDETKDEMFQKQDDFPNDEENNQKQSEEIVSEALPQNEKGIEDKHDDEIKDEMFQKQDDFPNDDESNQKQSEDIVSEALPQKEKGIEDKHDDETKDEMFQKQDDFPNDEENNQKQSEDIVSEALPQKEKGIEDKHDDEIKDEMFQKQDDFPNDEESNQKQSEDIVFEALPQKEKGIEYKHDDEIKDEMFQKQDDFPNDDENNQKQSEDIVPEALPQKEEDKHEEIFEPVCELGTSHMLGQEIPEKETAGKEEENIVDSINKNTEKVDREQPLAGDDEPFDEGNQSTNTKEKAKSEEEATLDEKPECYSKADESDTSDDQNQIFKDKEKTSNEDIRVEPEVNGQPADKSDIEMLKRENEKLKDKFNILKAIVGKWFVEEIPELRSLEKTEQEEEDSRSDDLGEDELKKLREEEKGLADEIKALEKEILQLKDMNDANNKKEEEELNRQELLALKQFEKADKILKKEEEKDLIELLKKEKEEVGKKLKELEMEIKDHEDQVSDDEKHLFDLMSKKLELEEDVALKARELDKNQKKLAQIEDDTEIAKLDEAVLSHIEQKELLEELLASLLSTDAQDENSPLDKQLSTVSYGGKRKDKDEQNNLPLNEAHMSPHVKELVKAKKSEEKKMKILRKNIEKAKRDKDRYNRMAKDRKDRLRPFIRKREKMLKSLREGETTERDRDEVLSAIEEIVTLKETPDEKAMADIKVEEIEREMTQIRDELSLLSEKAKIPLAMGSQTNALLSKLNELESKKDMIDQQITEKQSTMENLGSKEAAEVFDLLEIKAKLDVKRLDLQEAFPEGYKELRQEVQEAYELACLKQEIQNALVALDRKIQGEESNFKEAAIYQRQGKIDDPHSTIGPMLTRLQNLSLELEQMSSNQPCEDEADVVSTDVTQKESEDASKRIKEIEDLLSQNEDRIKEEPLRAAGELEKLIESKQNKTNELLKVNDALKEKIKMAELKENELQSIPESIQTAISLEEETDEEADLSFERVERENDIKERCLELQSLKSKGEDTKQKEDELLDIIEKQDPMLASDERQTSKVFDPLPVSVFAEDKAITSELENIEGKLEAILDGQSEKEDLIPELDDLGSLFQEKAEIEQNIKYHEHFNDLLNQERNLAAALKTAVNKKELEEIEQIIEHKEQEIEQIKAKSNEVEEMLEQLNDVKTNNEQSDDKLILDIQETFKETEQHLLEAQAEKERYYQRNKQEEMKVKEAMSSLEDEMEEKREEMEFVENELEGLRSISEDDSAVSPKLVELTKLLNSKKTLQDYLLEIDTKLEDCDDSAMPPLSPEEVQALKDEQRDAKRKIKEIQEEKSKFEVELQDEDIQENYASLCEERSRLEQAHNELLHKIHGSNVFVRMADELVEEEPSEEEQKYFTQALNKMLSDKKTLIKLAEENEKLKEASCRQRDLLENLNNSISASLGEDLAQAIAFDTNMGDKENIQLPTAIMDIINEKDKTIAEILNELGNENKKLTTLNEDLSNELDCLKEKIGETLSDAILQSNNQLLEEKLMAPIDEVMSADKTVEEILEDQKDALERLKDVIGEDLTDSLLRPREDISVDDQKEPLRAPKIMNETGEDLQTVLAAYEFNLNNLGNENDVLKRMLGSDLVRALLDIDQDGIDRPISEFDNVMKPHQEDEESGASQAYQKETKEGKQMPFVQEDYADEDSKLENEARKQQLSTKLKPRKEPDNADEKAASRGNIPQETEGESLESSMKPAAPTTSHEKFSETSYSPKQAFPESDAGKHGVNAPDRMARDNKTLGEVIRDYENELDTLQFRIGPNLYKEIIDAGVPDKDDDGGELLAEESEIESIESGKQLEGAAICEDARKASGNTKGDVSSNEQKGSSEQTKEVCKEHEDKQEMMPSDTDSSKIKENVIKEKQIENLAEDRKPDESISIGEKTLSARVTEKEEKQTKPQKTALAAPKKMIDENQSLEKVIEGYENDLENLKSRLGQELFQDILDVRKHFDPRGGSEARSEDEEGHSYFEKSGDVVASQEEQDNIEVTRESENKVEDMPSLETEKHDFRGQRSKGRDQPDNLDQVQLAANAIEQAYELNETKPILDADNENTSYVDDTKYQAPASLVEQKESSEFEAKSPSIAAPKRMIEKNQTLAVVVGGYENDLDILKSRLGPELYNKILDAGKIASTDLQFPETKTDNLQGKEQPEISGKVTAKTGNTDKKDRDKKDTDNKESKENEKMPYTRVLHSQDKTSMINDSPTTESSDDVKGSIVSEEINDLKDEGIKGKQGRELAHKPDTSIRSSKAQTNKIEISAPKYMVEDNKTLEDVIKGYETDLETLKSKLGPQLFTSLLGTSSFGDEHAKEESYDKTQQGKVFRQKQSSKIRNDGSKFGDDWMEKDDKDLDPGDVKENDKENYIESSLSDGETYLSDGELYESYNIPNVEEEGTKYKPSVDDELRFSAPTIMSKEGKTLGEVLESYENDLEALKSKLGPKLFDRVLKIAKHDSSEPATAGMAKEHYDGQTEIPTKELRTEELTEPDHKRDAEDTDAEKDSTVNIHHQEKSADDEPKGGDKKHHRTGTHDDELQDKQKDHLKKGLESNGIPVLISTDTDDSESLSKDYDLVAPKQMLEEKKTLEEIIANYENDLRDLRESLGPQLCDAILNARKGMNESTDASAVELEREESETERDHLVKTSHEKGEKTGSLKTEICKLVTESHPQEVFENANDKAKDIGETSETNRHSHNQDEREVQHEDLEDTSDFDKDIEEQQQAKQSSTTRTLQAPKMIAQGKKLGEILCGYENELGAVKSRIGPGLYEDIVNAGKPDRSYGRERILDPKKLEGMNKIKALDEALKETKDENIKGGSEEDEEKEESPSANDVISKMTKVGTKEEISAEDPERITGSVGEHTKDETKEVTSTEHHDDRNVTKQKEAKKGQEGYQEQEEDITPEDNNMDGLQLKAAKEMLAQNKTLEEIVQGYEEDLATINSKLGPELYQHVLETGSKDDETKAGDKERAFDEEIGSPEDNKQADSKTEDAIQGSSDRQERMISKVTQKQGEETSTNKADVDQESQSEKSTEDAQDSIDLHEKEMTSSQIKAQLKAPILLAQEGTTLQEIIEKYEKDLDAFSSRLGPNLTRAVVKARGKEINRKDDRDELPIKKVGQFLNQDMKDDIRKTDSSEINSNLDDAIHDKPIGQDEFKLEDKDSRRKAVEETEKQQEIDYYSDMFENDMTLEDAVNKLKKESEDLKEKLGPNLTKILLEEQMEKLKDEEGEKKEKEVDDSGTKHTGSSHTDSQRGSSSSGKENEEMLHEEEAIVDTAKTQDAKCEEGRKEDTFAEDDVNSKFSSKQKAFMAPKLMKTRNAPLEDVIQNYEHDLSVIKKALGPNLVDLLLNDKAKSTADKKTILSEANEDEEMMKTARDKEKTRRLEAESNRATWTEEISEEQRRADEEEKLEKTKKESEQEESKDNEEEEYCGQTELHESAELEKIVSPLLNGNKNNSLEDILKTLRKDLDVLTSKLGSSLSKCLLTMDADSYDVSKEKYLSDNCGKEGKALKQKDEFETLCEKMEDREAEKTVSGLEVEEKEEDELLKTEIAVEQPDDLAALDKMEENSETLEEVIKKYENSLERYESSLGPHLSKAILTKEITPINTAQESQAKSELVNKNAEQDVPLHEEEEEMKLSKVEEYLKLLDEGKTLEDVLIRYDPGDEVVITDESVPTNDQIKRLQKQNSGLRQELDNLKAKIGETLASQLQSKELDVHSQEQCEKETPQDDVAKIEDDKLRLEAPNIMLKDNRTLEEIVAQYENDLKEKTKIQDDLQQSVGPNLFKELCVFRRQKEEEEDVVEERQGSQNEEKQEKPSSEKNERLLLQSKYDAINKMAEETKNLEAVLGDHENDLKALERENESLKKALDNVSGDGADLGEIISNYENQITILENEKMEAENDFEEKHKELQNEIDDLRATLEKLAQTLRQDFLDDLMKQDSDNHIQALQIMEKENKTLAEVVEEYEENMKTLEREKAVLQQIAGQGEEGASMLDTINDYEDTIKGLKEVNKVLNKRMAALSDTLGPQLTKQLTDLCDELKPSKTSDKDDRTKEYKETMGAVKEMKDKNITLEEVLNMYDENNKREIASLDKADQLRTSEKGDKEVKALDEVNNNQDQRKPIEALSTSQTEEVAAGLMSDALCERIGLQLIGDIKQLDNKTYDELEKEDKRPYALRTMKLKNEQLEDIIEAYENTLSKYGLLDSSTSKGESLAAELQAAIKDDIKVEEEVLFGEQANYELSESEKDKENADAKGNEESGQQIRMLRKELEEEKALKEKYQKDAEDLLNDIIKLKMKYADGEEANKEDIEKQIKEDYERKHENKHLKEELCKEKEKNKELEDEKNEFKEEVRNMEQEIKNLEKAIEKMQGSARSLDDEEVDRRMRELLVKNENLEKELEALKNQLKENEENYKKEKNNLMEQFENEKRDTIKSLLDAKAEVEIKLQEQLELYHELEEKLKSTQEELDRSGSQDSNEAADNKDTEETTEKDEDKLAELRMRNESLKETLDLSEESMKDALQKYQEEIKALEVGKAKIEDDKNHEIELLNNKLELEKAALERLKNDYDDMLKKEKERQREDFEKDLEREKRRSEKDLEEQSEDFERKQNLHKQELKDANIKAEKEKKELRNSLEEEIEKLKKMFDEQMRQKDEEHEKVLNKLREQLEDQMVTEKAEMNVQFRQEKTELKTQIEKNIYGEELQKNIDLENDFQETLNKVLKDHANEIAEIEKEMAQEEERFRGQKLQLLEKFENEKLKEAKQHEKEKQEMESTIENLLKEIIKLKHQRKEMRQQYRVEKQSIEEIAEKERIEIQENMERSKNELITKLKEDHEKEMASEKEKYEAVIKELQEALDRAEAKKKEIEEKLRNESLKAEESLNNKSVDEASSREITREVKVIKRGIEIEYEQKLSIEKQRFEDTLQGLRREVGNLQEKRKIIQERVYNQEPHSTERQFIEKSITNYKLEVLSKLEAEMAHRIERERKPLEEEVRELQIENEELKRQRWEMKAQFRREKASLEEEFEREKEALENNLNKEKEELRKRLEAKLQKEKQNKAFDHVKVSRSTSPVPGESSPRIDNTVRMLKQENLSLVSQNAKHEIEIEQLSEKLKFMEMNFQEMMETEKSKAEKMKKIQEQIPKVEIVDPTLPAPEYKPPSTGTHDDIILHSLQEKDQQIHHLLETKKYYESVLNELCDEAGLFELDRNEIV